MYMKVDGEANDIWHGMGGGMPRTSSFLYRIIFIITSYIVEGQFLVGTYSSQELLKICVQVATNIDCTLPCKT